MRIEQLGSGEPEVAVVGGIHGDEPCGIHAVETLIEEDPPVERPVALVIANEEAEAQGVRYVERDLNRTFPGDPDSDHHEVRLAAELSEAIGDCETLSLHSTQSYDGPFAIAKEIDDWIRGVSAGLPIDALVDAGAFDTGRLFTSVPKTIEIECGYQGSETAAENAVAVTRAFLRVTGALPPAAGGGAGRADAGELPVFRLERAVEKSPGTTYEVYAENFERVAAGETFATADDEPVVAGDEFYPVLMSAEGYEELFGYAASMAGSLS